MFAINSASLAPAYLPFFAQRNTFINMFIDAARGSGFAGQFGATGPIGIVARWGKNRAAFPLISTDGPANWGFRPPVAAPPPPPGPPIG